MDYKKYFDQAMAQLREVVPVLTQAVTDLTSGDVEPAVKKFELALKNLDLAGEGLTYTYQDYLPLSLNQVLSWIRHWLMSGSDPRLEQAMALIETVFKERQAALLVEPTK